MLLCSAVLSGAQRCSAVLGGARRCSAVLSGAQRCSAVLSGAQRCSAVLSGAQRCCNIQAGRFQASLITGCVVPCNLTNIVMLHAAAPPPRPPLMPTLPPAAPVGSIGTCELVRSFCLPRCWSVRQFVLVLWQHLLCSAPIPHCCFWCVHTFLSDCRPHLRPSCKQLQMVLPG